MSVMEKMIPWDSGGGNLHLTYTGLGNGPIVITSDTENYTGETRTKLITISTSKGGTVVQQLTVKQPSRKAYVEGEILVFTRAATVSVSSDSLTIEDSDITVTNETLII